MRKNSLGEVKWEKGVQGGKQNNVKSLLKKSYPFYLWGVA